MTDINKKKFLEDNNLKQVNLYVDQQLHAALRDLAHSKAPASVNSLVVECLAEMLEAEAPDKLKVPVPATVDRGAETKSFRNLTLYLPAAAHSKLKWMMLSYGVSLSQIILGVVLTRYFKKDKALLEQLGVHSVSKQVNPTL